MHYNPLEGVYVYFRYSARQKVMIVLSKNSSVTELDTRRFNDMLTPRSVGTDVITGQRHELGRTLTLPARSALVLEVNEP